MDAVSPINKTIFDEPEVSFVNEGGGLQCVIGAFTAKMAMRLTRSSS